MVSWSMRRVSVTCILLAQSSQRAIGLRKVGAMCLESSNRSDDALTLH